MEAHSLKAKDLV